MKRTKEERQNEARIIVAKLTELKLTILYEPVRELLKILKEYIEIGNNISINIPFVEIHKDIVGHLSKFKNKDCWVMLKHRPNKFH